MRRNAMELKDLTTEVLSRFVSGQLEIHNPNEHYLYRGEVAEIQIDENGTLKVKFAWQAKMADTGRWTTTDEDLNYGVSLWASRKTNQPMCSVRDMGDGRLTIRVMVIWENLTFFPPNAQDKLDRAKVVESALAS